MPASIGVNLRVTGHCKQGGRKYMEDYFAVAYQQTDDEKDLEYAFFGIFDGHGGSEAALFAKEHLMEFIVRQRKFWSDRDDDVLKAIREGFIATHMAMLKEHEKWPRTASGLPSTAGTTASIAFIRRGRIFTGHVGDSGIILGYQNPGSPTWEARRLTKDHKPESRVEFQRIVQSGGKVVPKSGVPRVVWYRPQIGHKGPITRSTPFDEIPFLAVARSLGDLWSYNSVNNEFVVSPEPDTNVIPIDTNTFRCLIFGTDGLWNMISASTAVSIVQAAEQHNAMIVLRDNPRDKTWINPSMNLVERALDRWSSTRMRADNTSVVTLMLDPPGPPHAQVIQNTQKMLSEQRQASQYAQAENPLNQNPLMPECSDPVPVSQQFSDSALSDPVHDNPFPATGLQIMTRYEDQQRQGSAESSSSKSQYTEEYLDKLHQEFYASMLNDVNTYWEYNAADNADAKLAEKIAETVQINVVSSSSDLQKKAKMRPPSGMASTSDNDLTNVSLVQAGGSVSTSSKTSELKSTKKMYVLTKDVSSLNYGTKQESKYRERRCRSLGPSEADSTGVKTRNKTSENNYICEKQTRFIGPQTSASHITKSERTIVKEKCDSNFKRSKSLGPCDIKNNHDVQKNKFQKPTENITNNKRHLKNKHLDNINQNFQERRSKSLNSKDISQNQGPSKNIVTRSMRSNQSLLEKPVEFDGEYNLCESQLKRSKSLGPKDLYNLKTVQQLSKNKLKSRISRDKGHENVSLEKTNTKRNQSNVTDFKSKKSDLFRTPSPRTRSQGLIHVSPSSKKTRSIVPKQGVSNIENNECQSKSPGPKDMPNMPISSSNQGVRTRSCRTPEQSARCLRPNQNTPRPKKTNIGEENLLLNDRKLKRSQSLIILNLEVNDYDKTVKRLRSRPSRRESNEPNIVLSAPKFNRSELNPKELRSKDTYVLEVNLRERNILSDSVKTDTFVDSQISNIENNERRSRSLGPKDVANIPISSTSTQGVRTRSCRTPEQSSRCLRPTKRDRTDSDEENVVLSEPKMKRSRSLIILDLEINEYGQAVKSTRGRPPKRERNESDEENIVLSAPKFKRSRSLGPRDLRSRDTFVERNLRERNVLLDREKSDTSFSDVTIPITRSQRNRRLPN